MTETVLEILITILLLKDDNTHVRLGEVLSLYKVLSRVVGEAEMITLLNLCHHHKTQQLTCQSHRIEDHFVNPRTIPLQPYGMSLIMTWIVTMTN